jgi:hypothetical protein
MIDLPKDAPRGTMLGIFFEDGEDLYLVTTNPDEARWVREQLDQLVDRPNMFIHIGPRWQAEGDDRVWEDHPETWFRASAIMAIAWVDVPADTPPPTETSEG